MTDLDSVTAYSLASRVSARAATLAQLAAVIHRGALAGESLQELGAGSALMALRLEAQFLAEIADRAERAAGVRIESVEMQVEPESLEAANDPGPFPDPAQ